MNFLAVVQTLDQPDAPLEEAGVFKESENTTFTLQLPVSTFTDNMTYSQIAAVFFSQSSSLLYNFSRDFLWETVVPTFSDRVFDHFGLVPRIACLGAGRSLFKKDNDTADSTMAIITALSLYVFNAIVSSLGQDNSVCRINKGGVDSAIFGKKDVAFLSKLMVSDDAEQAEIQALLSAIDPYWFDSEAICPDIGAGGPLRLLSDMTVIQFVHMICKDMVADLIRGLSYAEIKARMVLDETIRAGAEAEQKTFITEKLRDMRKDHPEFHGLTYALKHVHVPATLAFDAKTIHALASSAAKEISTMAFNSVVEQHGTVEFDLPNQFLASRCPEAVFLAPEFKADFLTWPAKDLQAFLEKYGCSAFRQRELHKARINAAISAAGIAPGTMAWFENFCHMWEATNKLDVDVSAAPGVA